MKNIKQNYLDPNNGQKKGKGNKNNQKQKTNKKTQYLHVTDVDVITTLNISSLNTPIKGSNCEIG